MADGTVPEEWRPIEGWPYEVSNLGNVRRASDAYSYGSRAQRKLKPRYPKGLPKKPAIVDGYRVVHLYSDGLTKPFKIAKLVCLAFHGPPPSPDHEVAHWDGNRQNDIPYNLRWATRKENAHDRRRHGSVAGEKNPAAKLTNDQVREIRGLLDAGLPKKAIAGKYGVGRRTINSISLGARYATVPPA